jgi:hypothetical protein
MMAIMDRSGNGAGLKTKNTLSWTAVPLLAFLISQHKKMLVSGAGVNCIPWPGILNLAIEQLNHETCLNQQQKCDNLKR